MWLSQRRALRCAVMFLVAVCAIGAGADESLQADDRVARPALVLAMPASAAIDVPSYLVSEKLDGVRAYWDGRALWFRSGHPVPAPAWFVAHLPPRPLDGELWAGRGRFEAVSGWVRKTEPVDSEWAQVRYMVFELPEHAGSFTQRVSAIEALLAGRDPAVVQAVPQRTFPDVHSLHAELARVVKAGGEGLMLHRADAPYVTGRSDALLKLKPLDDAEAVVIGHQPGKGRHRGRLGALVMRAADGKTFRIGTGLSDALRESPPPIGATVTYTHRGLTQKGLPRFPSFWRVRQDP